MAVDKTPVTMRVNADVYKRVLNAARVLGVTVGQFTEASWVVSLKHAAGSKQLTKLAANEELEIARLSVAANEFVRKEGR